MAWGSSNLWTKVDKGSHKMSFLKNDVMTDDGARRRTCQRACRHAWQHRCRDRCRPTWRHTCQERNHDRSTRVSTHMPTHMPAHIVDPHGPRTMSWPTCVSILCCAAMRAYVWRCDACASMFTDMCIDMWLTCDAPRACASASISAFARMQFIHQQQTKGQTTVGPARMPARPPAHRPARMPARPPAHRPARLHA